MTARIAFLAGLLGCALAAQAEKVVIKGSNTFGEELGPRLVREYSAVNPGVTIELESKGSASGFAALLEGECDIAASSRLASEDETRLARSRGIRMRQYTIGYYGTAVIVNDANPLKKLTDAQVRDIFTGTIANWKDLGGEDAPIKVYIRDPVSGTYLGFQELAMEKKPYTSSAVALKSYDEIVEAVKNDSAAIGYSGMNLASMTGIHSVAINGIPPTTTSVNDQVYPYARQIRLYTAKGKEPEAALDFIQFVRSKQGQEILKEMGYVRRFESRQKLNLPEGN